MKQISLIIIILLIIFSESVFSQQTAQFTQYTFNTISFNPAYAGSREIGVITFLNRNQWVGLDRAPVTQTLTANTPIYNSNFGVGLSIMNDKLGYERTFYAYADVSYSINLDVHQRYRLAFGLKVGANKYSLDDELLNDSGVVIDPFFDTIDYDWRPNFGIGMYFRGESFYLGLSAPKLFVNENQEINSLDRPNVFLNGGYLFEANPSLKIKPSFLLKYVEGNPVALDLSALFYVNNNLWLGSFYRISDAFGAIVNFKIANNFSIGYSFDYSFSNLGRTTQGSHEIMLAYQFEFGVRRCKCPDLYN